MTSSGHQVVPMPPSHTRRACSITGADIEGDAIIVFAGDATEQRSKLPLWQELLADASRCCVVVEEQEQDRISVRRTGRSLVELSLRNASSLVEQFGGSTVYVDISGLGHHVWAPIIKAARTCGANLRVVYVEPKSYRSHPSPASPTVFDLSTGFHGLAPLPGFARLSGPMDAAKALFVALLGFEGNRPQRLALQLDPVPKVIPIVGVPGFRLEYPAFTIACNRTFLEEYRAHGEIRLARASCPFEAYDVLAELHRDYPDHYMYIAPVGTKPHSLGAVWFALDNPEWTEVMYDHPMRKAGRTEGIGLIHIYELSAQTNAGS